MKEYSFKKTDAFATEKSEGNPAGYMFLDSLKDISKQRMLKIAKELKEFCFKFRIDIIEVFTPNVRDKSNDYRTRVFAPTFGYIEDPATGSENSAFGYYLIENNLWKNKTITIEQNGLRDNFNIVKLQKHIDCDKTLRVYFGGGATTRIDGKYFIYE